MTYLPYLSLILVIYQYSMRSQCAKIDVSFSNTNVSLNGSFEINVAHFTPSGPLNIPSVQCGNPVSKGLRKDFVKYNPLKKVFIEVSPMPPEYVGRVTIRGSKTTIEQFKFSDEKKIFNCKFDYYDNDGNAGPTVMSSSSTIENVYALPVITANHILGSLTMIEGEPKEIICTVKSRPASKITWSMDPGVTGTKSESVQSDPTDSNYFITTGRFRINPVDAMKGKKVICTGIPVFGSAVSKTTTLNVLYKPRDTLFMVSPAQLTLNAVIQMTCSATGVPSVRNYKFYRNGLLIGNTSDGTLSFKVHPSNCTRYAGEYKCVPESTIGDGEMKTETIEFNSKITLTSSRTINVGQLATLDCSATDCPSSNITWKKNGAALSNIGSKLQLTSVTKDDAGTYSCYATFWKKVKSTDMTLTINYKPDIVQFTTLKSKPQNGDPVALSCSSNGMPAPTYRIYKITGSISTLIASSNSHSIANINYLDYVGYNATFRCESKNILGTTTRDLHLDIQVEPVFSLTLTPNTIMESQSTTIQCKVTAANPPASTTLRDPKDTIVPLVNGTTELTDVKRASYGIYSCTADNGIRSSPETKTANLIVQYKPDPATFTSSSSNPLSGTRMTLSCTAHGVPAPSYKIESVTGSKTETIRDTTSGTYSIAQINYANYFNYRVTFRCTAHNAVGSASRKEVKVNIQVKPLLVISKEKTIGIGEEATFSCNVTAANPATKVTWRNPSNEQIQHSNGFIKIKSVGTYTCLAKNSAGESKETVELKFNTKAPVTGKSSSAGVIGGGVIGGLLVLIIIALLIYFFVIRNENVMVCATNHRLRHDLDHGGEYSTDYTEMFGVKGEEKKKYAHATDESPLVNESGSKEPNVPAEGAEKPDQYSANYISKNGLEYSAVTTRGSNDRPGVSVANEAPKDQDNSKGESRYAEIAAFNFGGNKRSPSDIPEATQYTTVEECGPIAKNPPTTEYENVAQIMGTPTEI